MLICSVNDFWFLYSRSLQLQVGRKRLPGASFHLAGEESHAEGGIRLECLVRGDVLVSFLPILWLLKNKHKFKHMVQSRLPANWQAPNKHTSNAWRRLTPPCLMKYHPSNTSFMEIWTVLLNGMLPLQLTLLSHKNLLSHAL